MLQPAPPSPIDDHGPRLTGNTGMVPHPRVQLVVTLLNLSPLVPQLEHWETIWRGRKGGRPASMTFRQVLAIKLLLALEHSPMQFLLGAQMITHRLEPQSLELLGITPLEPRRHVPAQMQRVIANRIWDDRLKNGFKRMVALMNPYPGMQWKRMRTSDWEAEVARRDPDDMAEMWRRLDWFCNQLTALAVLGEPSALAEWHGNRVIDGTAFAVFSKKGHNKKSQYRSSYAEASWYLRTANHQIPIRRSQRIVKAFFGFEIHLVAATSNVGSAAVDKFPHLVIGISFGRPAEQPASLGLKAITASHQNYTPSKPNGLVVGDRGYFANAKPETLQIPVRELGFRIMTDYRDKQLGKQAGWAGSILVEGAFYCPAMPVDLQTATIDRRAGSIDYATWRKRIQSRKPYLLRAKTLENEDGMVRMMCPALGRSNTVRCPLRQQARPKAWDENRRDKKGKRFVPIPILKRNLPQPLERDRICTNKADVSFPREAAAKLFQHIRFGTDHWKKLYSHARQVIESMNQYVKDESHEALASPGRRRVRGAAQQYVTVSMLIFSANMRRIETWKYGHPTRGMRLPTNTNSRRDITNGYRFDPITGEGLAPKQGETSWDFVTPFNGDVQGASIDWEQLQDPPDETESVDVLTQDEEEADEELD